jgi:hypothetical protein
MYDTMSTTSSIASIMGNENSNRMISRNASEERPKQRRRLLIKEKAGILQWMDANKKTLEETCQEFDLSISTLAKWRMRRNEIIHQANSAQGNLKSHHAPKFPQVEAKVLAWIVMQQQEDEANAAVAASNDDTLTTTSTPTAPITNKTIEQYFHQAKREVLAQMGGSEHDHEGLTEEELRKKRKLERLSVSPEFVRNFMFRHGFPTSDQEDIFAFASEMTSPMMNTNMQNIPMINTTAPIHQQQQQQLPQQQQQQQQPRQQQQQQQ